MMHFIHPFKIGCSQIEIPHVQHYLHFRIIDHSMSQVGHYIWKHAVISLLWSEIPWIYLSEYFVLQLRTEFELGAYIIIEGGGESGVNIGIHRVILCSFT